MRWIISSPTCPKTPWFANGALGRPEIQLGIHVVYTQLLNTAINSGVISSFRKENMSHAFLLGTHKEDRFST